MSIESTTFMDRLREMADGVARREGVELYDLEFVSGSRGKGRTLRVYVDRKGTGVSVDDCANVSRGMSLLLDVDDLVPGGEYELEVSSPGLDRVLRSPSHFQAVIGKKIQVKTTDTLDRANPDFKSMKNRKQAVGHLVSASETDIRMKVGNDEITVPLSILHRGNVIHEFTSEDFKQKHPTGEEERGS